MSIERLHVDLGPVIEAAIAAGRAHDGAVRIEAPAPLRIPVTETMPPITQLHVAVQFPLHQLFREDGLAEPIIEFEFASPSAADFIANLSAALTLEWEPPQPGIVEEYLLRLTKTVQIELLRLRSG